MTMNLNTLKSSLRSITGSSVITPAEDPADNLSQSQVDAIKSAANAYADALATAIHNHILSATVNKGTFVAPAGGGPLTGTGTLS